MVKQRRSKQSRRLFLTFLVGLSLSSCGGNDPQNASRAGSATESVALATGSNSEVPISEASSDVATKLRPCDGLPAKAAIEKIMGVSLSDPVERPVGCELRGIASTSDVASFTRQTLQEKNATLKYIADTGGSAPTELGDPALPGALSALSYSVLYDKGETSYVIQVVVGDGPAGSGQPKAIELMKLWVGK